MGESGLLGIALALVYSAVDYGVGIAAIVVALVRWSHTRAVLKVGLILGGLIFLLGLPAQVVSMIHLDTSQLGGGVLDPELMDLSVAVGFGCGLFGSLLAVGHKVALVSAATLAPDPPRAFPLLYPTDGGERRLAGLWQGAAYGAVTGLASVAVFILLDVQVSQTLQQLMELLPGLQVDSPLFLLGCTLPAVLGAAIAEELLFRGVIQRWLTRWFGGTTAAAAGAILIASLIWALGHALNADPMWVKMLQIFLVGLGFGALSARYGVESAIASHMTFNAVAIVAATLWPT